MNVLQIDYEAEGFPAAAKVNGSGSLEVSWGDLLWAAMTVGRPNRQYVFRDGAASVYEAVFRASLVRMTLEQRGSLGRRLWRTEAAKTLDPTEKGAVSYFLGMAICKVFATKMLKTPWLLHLDVWRPFLDMVLKGRSRPDLVGKPVGSTQWHAFECKGRVSAPNTTVKVNAKVQASRLGGVEGQPCDLHIGAITYFRGDVLQFYWCDPPARRELPPIVLPKVQGDIWSHYYGPVVHAIEGLQGRPTAVDATGEFHPIQAADLAIGLHPSVAGLLRQGAWQAAHESADEAGKNLARDGYQPDGLLVRAGASWQERFRE